MTAKNNQEELQTAVKTIIGLIGEDARRVGLQDTPRRVAKAYKELFAGYDEDALPAVTVFPNGEDGLVYDQMIVDTGKFYSHCEHHMIPFFGTYTFAYIPSTEGNILGLSKVARVMDYFAAKLQVQERLGQEVVDYLWSSLNAGTGEPPLGMAIALQATHMCKCMRGVRKEGLMTTVALKGAFRKDPAVKQEFLSFINGGHK